MSRPRRTAKSGTFFLTAVTLDRRHLFKAEAKARLFLENLQIYRKQGLYKLHAFVVMPDHFRLLITTQNLPEAMKHIRGGFSYRLSSNWEIWQPGYTDHQVLNREQFESRRDYIHQNPVRAGLVERAEQYPFSSAFRG